MERGDVVVYKSAGNPMAALNGTVAVVISKRPAGDEWSIAPVVLPPGYAEQHQEYLDDPFFYSVNCQIIGHIDLDAAERGAQEGEKRNDD